MDADQDGLGGDEDYDEPRYGLQSRAKGSPVIPREFSDDQHPGFDYKRKRRLPRTQSVDESGMLITEVDDDLRPNRYGSALSSFKMSRWGAFSEDEE